MIERIVERSCLLQHNYVRQIFKKSVHVTSMYVHHVADFVVTLYRAVQ